MDSPDRYDLHDVVVGDVHLFFSGLSFWKKRVLFCFDSLKELRDYHKAVGLIIEELERAINDMGRERTPG